MLRRFYGAILALGVLAGCTAAGGPTYSAWQVAQANGEKAFRVTCFGMLEDASTCFGRAQRICGNQQVRTLEDAAPLGRKAGERADTRILTFQCGVPSQPQPQPQPAPQPQPSPPPPPPPPLVTLAADATFDFDQATLTPAARLRLDKLISDANANALSFGTVSVNGYTDSTGPDGYNQRLSERRAQAVAQYLQQHGLRAGQYSVRGFGKANPVETNATVAGRAANRRVELVLPQVR